jgi:8-oxo-dGTP diphosphatase
MEKKFVKAGFGVLIMREGKVLFGKRHEDPKKADSDLGGEGTWTMPGGKMDFGEEIIVGAAREVLEETGLVVNKEKMQIVSITNDIAGDSHYITIGFFAPEFFGEPKVMEPNEITEWGWFSIDDLPKKIFLPSMKLLKNYLDKKIYSP